MPTYRGCGNQASNQNRQGGKHEGSSGDSGIPRLDDGGLCGRLRVHRKRVAGHGHCRACLGDVAVQFDPSMLHRHVRKLSPRQKKAIHFAVIAWIGISLWQEGGGHADWSFLLLSFMCELS